MKAEPLDGRATDEAFVALLTACLDQHAARPRDDGPDELAEPSAKAEPEPDNSAEPADAAEPNDSAQVSDAGGPDAAEPDDSTEPGDSAQAPDAAEPDDSTEPGDAAEPGDSAEPAAGQPAEPVPALVGAITDELRTMTTWTGPPAGLRDSILASVRTRAAAAATGASPAAAPAPAAGVPTVVPAVPVVPAAGAATPGGEGAGSGTAVPEPDGPAVPDDGPVPAPDHPAAGRWNPARWRTARWRARLARPAWAVPAAVLGAAAFTVGVLAVDRALAPDPPRPDMFVATGTSLAPDARAEVSVLDTPAGVAIAVEPTGLPAAAPGSYYAAWLRGADGSVPIGSFHWRRTGVPIDLWSGVDTAEYATLVITLQAEGGPPGPSALVVMTASLAP